jgi:hypothetical protein
LDGLDKGQEGLRRDVDRALEASRRAEERCAAAGTTQAFVPRSFDVKGGCAFGMADSEGFTAEFAEAWLEKVKQKLPEALRPLVGAYSMKGHTGSRAAIISVLVTDPSQLPELLRVLGRMLKDDTDLAFTVAGEDRQLYITPDRSEADRLKYRTMGRLKDKTMKLRAAMGDGAQGEIRIVWKPRFAVVDDETDDPVISVREDGTYAVDEAGALKLFGRSGRDLRRELQGSY